MTYIKANHGAKESGDLPAHKGSYYFNHHNIFSVPIDKLWRN
jgi:hypothetical protein